MWTHARTHTRMHAHTNARTHIPPTEWDKPLLYNYSIRAAPHKFGLLTGQLHHAVRWCLQSAFCLKVYLHTTDVVQPHRGVQWRLKPSFLPGSYC